MCSECKRFVMGEVCPACKTSKLTRNWQGIVIVIDPDSEIARAMNITVPGKYAISINR